MGLSSEYFIGESLFVSKKKSLKTTTAKTTTNQLQMKIKTNTRDTAKKKTKSTKTSKTNKKLDEDATEALGEVDVNQDIDNQNDEMPAFPAEDNEENGLGDEDADVDSGEINETIQLV